jgi:hypothetical protein
VLPRDAEDAEAHEELHAAVRGVELRQAREHGRARLGQGRREVGARLLGHVGGRGRVERARDRVRRGEAFALPGDDRVCVAGAREDEGAVDGDAGVWG